MIEAWPKLQELRAQYKLVQIALEKATYQPHALLMYAPNFHPKTAPKWDHYEFKDIKRNAVAAGFQRTFLGNFIPSAPPKSGKIRREALPQQRQQEKQQPEQAQKPANIRG